MEYLDCDVCGSRVPAGGANVEGLLSQLRIARELYGEILGPEITARRAIQDAKWGGPQHDDTHTKTDWLEFIERFTDLSFAATNPDEYEGFLMDVVALGVAAIQSNRRKRSVESAA